MKRLASLLLLLLVGNVHGEYRYPFAGGSIVRLDAATKQLTLKTDAGPKNFLVTDQTYLFNGTERLTFDKLKLGDEVRINYATNETGHAVINRLKIYHPPTDGMVDKTK